MTNWDERYAGGHLPWDTGEPAAHLVEYFATREPKPARVLEVGCGTGTNALWLAGQGCTVLGIDIAPRAIAKAKAKAEASAASRARFAVVDFLHDELPDAEPFDFVFDRGVLHVFDEASERERFAARVAAQLVPGGTWLSLIGSTEGPPREEGPPRRNLGELADAIEPVLEILELRSIAFDIATPARAWWLVARKRDVAAQPSTRRG